MACEPTAVVPRMLLKLGRMLVAFCLVVMHFVIIYDGCQPNIRASYKEFSQKLIDLLLNRLPKGKNASASLQWIAIAIRSDPRIANALPELFVLVDGWEVWCIPKWRISHFINRYIESAGYKECTKAFCKHSVVTANWHIRSKLQVQST